MKKILLSLLVTLSIFSLNSCSDASSNINQPSNTGNQGSQQEEKVTISGIVHDENDQPVSGVEIVVKAEKQVLGQTTSNNNGEFSLDVQKVFGDSYFVEANKKLSDGSLDQTILVSSEEDADFTGNNKLKKTKVADNPVPAP